MADNPLYGLARGNDADTRLAAYKSLFSQSGDLADYTSRVAGYRRSVQGGLAAGISGIPLAADLQVELARQIAMRGPIDPSLADAIGAVPELQTLSESFALADTLNDIATDINLAEVGARAQIPNAPNPLTTAIGGAAAGATIGGPVGAAVGGAAGLFAGLSQKGQSQSAKGKISDQAAKARALTEPAGIAGMLQGLTPEAREYAASTGVANTAAQNLQAAISRSGLRDSALGTLGGVAAAAIPSQVARQEAIRRSLQTTRTRVEGFLRTPLREPRDRLTEALGAAAEGFLTFHTLFPGKGEQAGSSSLLPGGEDLFRTDRPQFKIPEEDFLPRP